MQNSCIAFEENIEDVLFNLLYVIIHSYGDDHL